MKVDNKTDYDTSAIKKLLSECMKRRGADLKGYRVKIIYGKYRFSQFREGEWVGGLGSYGRKWMCLKLPREKVNPVALASTVYHEISHNLNLYHNHMLQKYDVDWAKDFTIPKKIKKEKPIRDIKEVRYERILSHIARKEKQLKRLKTALRKLYRKKKYYERKLKSGAHWLPKERKDGAENG